MTDRNKDPKKKPEPEEELPVEDEFEEEPEEALDSEAEGEREEALEDQAEDEGEGEGAEAPGAGVTHRRFTLGRGGRFDEETDKRQIGSVRGTHERVHIDDRPSIIYALVCAIGLAGVLALAWLGGVLPKNAGPTLGPLIVPTAQPTPSASATAAPSITVAPSPTAAPTASPSPSAT